MDGGREGNREDTHATPSMPSHFDVFSLSGNCGFVFAAQSLVAVLAVEDSRQATILASGFAVFGDEQQQHHNGCRIKFPVWCETTKL